jgi:hypothetical protein
VRRNLIPQAFLGVLTVLSLGAVVLAASETPNAASEAVQTATTATFGSPLGSQSISLNIESNVSAGQGSGILTQILKIKFETPNTMTVYRATAPVANLGSVRPQRIVGTLARYAAITAGSAPWTEHGSQYTRTESLIPFYQRVYQKTSLPGTVYESAIVQNGYLVDIHFNVVVRHQNSSVSQTYRIVSIGGKPVPAVNP